MDLPLRFEPGVDRVRFNVTTVEDELLEGTESLDLRLDTSDPAVILNPQEAVLAIIDDDSEFFVL